MMQQGARLAAAPGPIGCSDAAADAAYLRRLGAMSIALSIPAPDPAAFADPGDGDLEGNRGQRPIGSPQWDCRLLATGVYREPAAYGPSASTETLAAAFFEQGFVVLRGLVNGA